MENEIANLVGPQDSIPLTNKRQENWTLQQHQPFGSTTAKKISYLPSFFTRGSRVKVDQSQFLRVARMSDSDSRIDQLLDMRRVIVARYQVHVRICRLTDREVHDVL